MSKTVFHEQGYFLARQVYGAEEMAGLQTAFDRILDGLISSGGALETPRRDALPAPARRDGGQLDVQPRDVHRYSAAWLQALMQPDFLALAAEFLGPDIVLHHSSLCYRPGPSAAGQPLHQDWNRHPTVQDTMIVACIQVTDTATDAGGPCVYPGTQRLGRIGPRLAELPSTILQQYPLEQARRIEARVGDVLFLHGLVLHGWVPNLSHHPCKAVLAYLHAGEDRTEFTGNGTDGTLVLRGWTRAGY